MGLKQHQLSASVNYIVWEKCHRTQAILGLFGALILNHTIQYHSNKDDLPFELGSSLGLFLKLSQGVFLHHHCVWFAYQG